MRTIAEQETYMKEKKKKEDYERQKKEAYETAYRSAEIKGITAKARKDATRKTSGDGGFLGAITGGLNTLGAIGMNAERNMGGGGRRNRRSHEYGGGDMGLPSFDTIDSFWGGSKPRHRTRPRSRKRSRIRHGKGGKTITIKVG